MAEQLQLHIHAILDESEAFIQNLEKAGSKGLSEGILKAFADTRQQVRALLEGGDIESAFKKAMTYSRSFAAEIAKLDPVFGDLNVRLNTLNERLEKLKADRSALEESHNAKLSARFVETTGGQHRYDTEYARRTFKSDVDAIKGVLPAGVKIPDNWNPFNLAQTLNKARKTDGLDPAVIKQIEDLITKLGYKPTDVGNVALSGKVESEYQETIKDFKTSLDGLDLQIKETTESLNKLKAEIADRKSKGESLQDKVTNEAINSQAQHRDAASDAYDKQKEAVRKAKDEQRKHNAILEDTVEVQKEATDATNNNTGAIGKAVTTFFGYQMVLRQIRKLWREAIHTITELDKQLTNQAIVTNLTREETWKLVTTYQELADQAGVTQTEIAGVTTEYLRQGETLQNALTLTKAATAAATVAGISAQDSVKYLTTAIHGFKLEAEDALAVSDKFAALAAQAATNYEDLAVALSKVASQAELAGMSMDYTLALLTTGLDITQEAPESIGTALKTVIARMREISDYGKTLDDEMNLNQVEAGLKAVGIELRSGTGELRSTEAVLDELGRKWTELSANQQAAVAKALAGTRQQSRLVAIMENYDDVIKNMNVANNSLGATTAQQVKYLQGMEAAMNRLQNAYQSLIESFVKSDFVVGIVNTITNLLQKVQKFLNNPAGRTALITGVISFLLKSKEFVEKIRSVLNQMLATVGGIRKEEERITAERKKQLDEAGRALYHRAGVSDEDLERGGYGKGERPNGWMSNRPGANFTDALGSIFNPLRWGRGWKGQVVDTWSNWNQNNAPWTKFSEHRQRKKDDQTLIDDSVEKNKQLIELEKQLAESRKKSTVAEEEYNKAILALNENLDDETAGIQAQNAQQTIETESNQQLEIENKIKELRKAGLQDTAESQKTLKVLNSKVLSREQKIEFLKTQEWVNSKKAALAEIDRKKTAGEELSAEEKKLDAAREGVKAEIQKKEASLQDTVDNANIGRGAKFSKGVSAAAGIASAAAGLISMIQGMVETIQNRYKEIVDNAIDKGNEIQSKIYENTQTMTNLQNLSDDLHKLDRQVVKTADSMKQLEDVRTQLLTELELTEAESRLYTNQQLYDKAIAKRAELEKKNQELLVELGDTLLGAANNYDAAAGAMNILSKVAMGAGIGAMATSWAAEIPIITAIGTAVGAVIGGVVGMVEEINKKMASDDAKGKVHEMLQSDEGVSQMRYYFKAVYKNTVDTTTLAGKELANSVKTTYASLMDSLSGEDMEKLLNEYNWDAQAMADSLSNSLAKNADALKVLTGDSANYQQRVQAASEMYQALAAESEILGNAFLEQYGAYIQLGVLLGDSVKVMDEFKWSMTDMNELLTQLAEDGWSAAQMSEVVAKLGAAMEDGTLSSEELADAMGNMSDEAVKAAQKLIANGQDMQSLADQFTYAKNQVTNIRDTQSKWDSMSASDRQRFITENEDFFNQEGAYEAFINGEDITKFIESYKEELQGGLLKATSDLIMATETELYRLEREYEEETDEDKRKQLEKQIASAKRELKELQATYEDVNSIFDLSLSEVVKKQNEQIAKLKEMYQAEEKTLTESLQKRKEAYQDYFDSLREAERIEEYTESRDQLLSSISRLSGGTDATSRNKMRDLQKQLKELEKQEAQQRKEDARQAVIDNIDDQIEQIQEKFDELLSSNAKLLASMDESTEMQYLNYLATLGLTDEDAQLRAKELGDLLRGRWTTGGRQDFGDISVPKDSVPVVDVEPGATQNSFNVIGADGTAHTVELTAQQMQTLITQMLQQINRWTGSSYATSSAK